VVNTYLNERTSIVASNKYRPSGRNSAIRFNCGWITSLGVYRLSGRVRYGPAYPLR
jgi:hypothetical protein